MKKYFRGQLARASRQKRLAQRKRQDLSDLASNTSKRRRLARRLSKEQPLFAFHILDSLITGYTAATFLRDSRPTKSRAGKRQLPNARMELHQELIDRILVGTANSKSVNQLHLNWANRTKPFTFVKFGERYRFPNRWPLAKVRACSLEMYKINTREDLDSYWSKTTSFGS